MRAILLIFFISFLSVSAQAVDLSSRLGIGLSQQLGAAEVPMITAHYYPNSRFGMSIAFGLDTKDNESKLGALAKATKILFTEQQMNFYMAGAVGFVNHEETSAANVVEDKSNVEMSALLGGEFFFSGLDSLGLSFETGISVITGDGGTRFRTIADHPFRAGIVFYF